MFRVVAIAMSALALVFPVTATAETILRGNIVNQQMPLLGPDGGQVDHLDAGPYTFSLTDRTADHSFHVKGPYDAYGFMGSYVDFSTAGPEHANIGFVSQTPLVWENVELGDGRYYWHCDKHENQMFGNMTVGNYLSVSVGTGKGSVRSDPAGIFCTGTCGMGVPTGGPEVTLTAAPAAGYVFDRWEGSACSGPGPCTVTVNGFMQTSAMFRKLPSPPPPPPEVAPGSVKQVKPSVTRGKRLVTVTLDLTASAAATAQLRVGGRTVATAAGTLAAGKRTLKIAVPKKTKAGPASVRVTLKRTGSSTKFVVNRSVRLPRV